eukprot:g8627.t1
MHQDKYLTEQERVDNLTMKIENENLIGSGFIKHPPQERRPQRSYNDDFRNRNPRFDGFNRRGGRSRYHHQRRNYGPRSGGGGGQYWSPPYNDMSGGGRPPFRPFRGGGAPPRGHYPSHRSPYHSRPSSGHYQGGPHDEMNNFRPPHLNQSNHRRPYANSSWRAPPNRMGYDY